MAQWAEDVTWSQVVRDLVVEQNSNIAVVSTLFFGESMGVYSSLQAEGLCAEGDVTCAILEVNVILVTISVLSFGLSSLISVFNIMMIRLLTDEETRTFTQRIGSYALTSHLLLMLGWLCLIVGWTVEIFQYHKDLNCMWAEVAVIIGFVLWYIGLGTRLISTFFDVKKGSYVEAGLLKMV